VLRAVGWLGHRYRVEFDWRMFRRDGLFAGNDDRRLAELDAALRDPALRAVLVARGGHGLGRIAHLADLAALRQHPKWIVGFSDVTALHAELSRAGYASLHAPNAAGLGRADARTREQFVGALENPTRPRRHDRLSCWQGGRASGPLAGGNLTVLFTSAAAGRLRLPPGCILLLEDVTELTYRIDRMLTALLVSGALAEVAAVAVGEFIDCPSSPHGVPVEAVLQERLSRLGVPVVAGLPFGHGIRNEPLPLGVGALVDADRGLLAIGD